MKKFIGLIILAFGCCSIFASEPDMLVTQEGETFKVYNLDVTSGDNIYYTLQDSSDAALNKILKKDVLIIKKADGTTINPNETVTDQNNKATIAHEQSNAQIKKNPGAHDPVTHKVTSESKGLLNVTDGEGQELTMKVLNASDKTLEVTKPRKGLKYENPIYIIPDSVEYNGEIYTVESIGKEAFKNVGFWVNDVNVIEIKLPNTLKTIGWGAFAGRDALQSIIIPDSVETIGDWAFTMCGRNTGFKELYIPETVKRIGQEAFRNSSPTTSYRGYFQGYISSMPPYITTSNCKDFGIDEEAVENYYRRNK